MRSLKETFRKIDNHLKQVKLSEEENQQESIEKLLNLIDCIEYIKQSDMEDLNKLNSFLNKNTDKSQDVLPF